MDGPSRVLVLVLVLVLVFSLDIHSHNLEYFDTGKIAASETNKLYCLWVVVYLFKFLTYDTLLFPCPHIPILILITYMTSPRSLSINHIVISPCFVHDAHPTHTIKDHPLEIREAPKVKTYTMFLETSKTNEKYSKI